MRLKKSTTSLLVCSFILIILSFLVAAQQTPILPLVIRGDVTINGADAPIGTEIKAFMDGEEAGKVLVTKEGTYALIVEGTDEDTDKEVTLYVNDVDTGKSTTWGSGKVETLELAIITEQETTTTEEQTTTTTRRAPTTTKRATTTTTKKTTATTEKEESSVIVTPPKSPPGKEEEEKKEGEKTEKDDNSPPILITDKGKSSIETGVIIAFIIIIIVIIIGSLVYLKTGFKFKKRSKKKK